MTTVTMNPSFKLVLIRCYWTTIFTLILYFAVYSIWIALIIVGYTDENTIAYTYVGYAFVLILLSCFLLMLSYPILLIRFLWQRGDKRRAIRFTLSFVLCSVLIAYTWFYAIEIKKARTMFSSNLFVGHIE